jgi:hypothetical protein
MAPLKLEDPPKRILVIWYSQSGQLGEIVDSVLIPFKAAGIEIVQEVIRPVTPFPFPWSAYRFLDVFPESFQEICCQLEPLGVAPDADFDLTIIAYQVWYLSPSLPISSFLQYGLTARLLRHKRVLTIVGARNMWYRAHEVVKGHLRAAGARLVGHIALTDAAFNLVSVVTIVHWMLSGRKERFLGLFPRPGIRREDVARCVAFGRIVLNTLSAPNIQPQLDRAGACRIAPHLMVLENAASRMFRVWSKLILRADKRKRPLLVRLFGFYLAIGIVVLSPLAFLWFYAALPFRRAAVQRQIDGVRRY